MIRYLTAALAVLCLAFGGLAWFWQRQAEEASDALSAARARLEQVEAAAEVHRAHIARMEREAARWGAIEQDLKAMEGRDAPASDLLLRSGRVLWP